MSIAEFPLLDLFTQLQKAGIPLGIVEYQLVLKGIQSGFGVQDTASLKRLCETLWVKSEDEQLIFNHHFESLANNHTHYILPSQTDDGKKWTPPIKVLEQQTFLNILRWLSFGSLLVGVLFLCIWIGIRSDESEQPPDSNNQTSPNGVVIGNNPDLPPPLETPELDAVEANYLPLIWVAGLFLLMAGVCFLVIRFIGHLITQSSGVSFDEAIENRVVRLDDEIELAQSFGASIEKRLSQRLHLSGTKDYFPITQRQLKQGWRYLRRPIREGAKTELDIKATVQQIGQNGMFVEPAMIPRRTNCTELLLLIDQGGSMVPFELLSQRLIDTASRAGKLGNAQPLFFHNCFDNCVYLDKTMWEARPIGKILSQVSKQTVVLIFSDAGAARGRLNLRRFQMTQRSLEHLRQYVRYITWLNPFPQERWTNTTAMKISDLVFMFEIDRHGFQKAIDLLRGK